jgi:hypothetical protein
MGKGAIHKTWAISEARARIGDLFDAAIESGPQKVMRRERDAVIVLSETEFLSLRDKRPAFAEYLLNCPVEPGDMPKRRPARVLGTPAP